MNLLANQRPSTTWLARLRAALLCVLPCLLLALSLLPRVSAQIDPDGAARSGPDVAAALNDRFEDIMLDQWLTGDAGGAARELDSLFDDVLAAPTFDDQLQLLEWVAVGRARALVEDDRLGAALQSFDWDGSTPDGEGASILLGQLAERPAVLALRRQLQSGTASPGEQDPGGEIDAAVAKALLAADAGTIFDLGQRAIPALLAHREPGAASMPDAQMDAYLYLGQLDGTRALRVVREDLESGALALAGRAARALSAAFGKNQEDYLLLSAGRPGQLVSQDAHAVLVTLLGHPELLVDNRRMDNGAKELRKVLERLAMWDAFDRELADAMGHSLLAVGGRDVRTLIYALADTSARMSLRFAYEVLLAHESEPARLLAAQKLAELPVAGALLDRVADPAPAVRAALAWWFVPRRIQVPVFRDQGVGNQWVTRRQVLTPAALDALALLCADPDAAVRQVAVRGLVHGVDEPLQAPLYEALARDPDARVRALLAELDGLDPELSSRLMMSLAGDGSPGVRLALVGRAERSKVLESDGVPLPLGVGGVGVVRLSPLPPALRARVLSALAFDSEPAVRERAVQASLQAPELALPPAFWSRVLEDRDPGVRLSLAQAEPDDLELRLALLEGLVNDPDRELLAAVDENLRKLLKRDGWQREAPRALDLIDRRHTGPRHPLLADDQAMLVWSVEGMGLLMRWTLRDGETALWDAFGSPQAAWNMKARSSFEGPVERFTSSALRLDNESLSDLLRLAAAREGPFVAWISAGLSPLPAEREGLARALWEAPDTPRALRLIGARAAARGAHPDDLRRLHGLLADLDAADGRQHEQQLADVTRLVTELPDAAVNGWIADCLSDAALPLEIKQLVAAGMREQGPGAGPLAHAVLELWFERRGERLELVDRALKLLGAPSGDLDQSFLEGALDSPYGPLVPHLLEQRGRPSSVPVLGAGLLRVDELAELWETSDQFVSGRLVDALVSYLSDEAADTLLSVAAKTLLTDRRQEIMDGVQRIQAYQDARTSWDRRLSNRATREGAVAQLLELLSDDDSRLRAEAARGLATLHAVEQLPALVRLLKDDDASVRAAAGEALDALHRLALDDTAAGG